MINISRYDPFQDVFSDLLPTFRRAQSQAPQARMQMDVYENDNAYLVSIAVPGVRKEDIGVSIYQNQVTVTAEARQEKQAGDEAKPLLLERGYGKVSRTLTLPVEVDENSAEARSENGVLTLVLPKRADSGAKKLTIN